MRVHLPVVQPVTAAARVDRDLDRVLDRRFVLRGMAAALVGSLLGCGTDVRPGGNDDGLAPDGGAPSPTPTPGDAASLGYERCGDELCIDLADPANAALRTVDGARLIILDGKRLLVIRIGASELIALSAICTHSGCTVRYAPTAHDIQCPCHGSRFDLDGAVTRGPAELPLTRFGVSFDQTSQLVRVALA